MMKYRITGKMLRHYQKPAIKQLLDGDKQHAYLCLPRRSGKTILGFYFANAKICKEYDKIIHIIIFAKEKAQCKEIYSRNLLENGTPLFGILPQTATYIPYASEIQYKNGSTIKFAGSDSMEALRGNRYDVIILDELATYKYSIETFFPFLRDIKRSTLVCISTLRGKNHYWELKKYAEQRKEKWIVEHENVFSLGIMTQEEYDDLPGEENFKRQEYLCDPDAAFIGAVYAAPNFERIEFQHGQPVYAAVDIAELDDSTAFTFCQVVGNKVKVFEILEFKGVFVGDTVKEIFAMFQKYKITIPQVTFFLPHDANRANGIDGKTRKQFYQQYGFKCLEVPSKGLIDGIHLVRSFWHDIIFDTVNCVNGTERIKAYVSDEDGRPADSRGNHRNSHVPDSLRYLIIGLESKKIIKSWKIYNTEGRDYTTIRDYNAKNNRISSYMVGRR
jgi:hypothetical protein